MALPRASQPHELKLSRAVRLFGRALRLHCPNCGGGGIFASYFRLHTRCPTCGLQLERGESDYFLGAYLFNLIAVELLFAGALAITVIATWPSPPWRLLEYGGAALMALGAVACYPLAKTTWLAFDLMLRPVTPEEMAWHRRGNPPTDRPPHQ